MTEQKRTIYRDSGTGQIITREYAEKHPKTTEKKRVNPGKPPVKPAKK